MGHSVHSCSDSRSRLTEVGHRRVVIQRANKVEVEVSGFSPHLSLSQLGLRFYLTLRLDDSAVNVKCRENQILLASTCSL